MNTVAARIALKDVIAAFQRIGLAMFLAWEDIRQRYVRTMLGPIWIVLTTGVWFGVMGFVMANLFGSKIDEYLPFLVAGVLTWTLISTCISESSQILMSSTSLITSFRIPIFTHYVRFLLRNIVIFFHNIIILVLVLIIFPVPFTAFTWLVVPGFILNLLILTSLSLFLSLANLRYRDTHLAINSAMQVLPFITPIYWDKGQLQAHHWVADVNPLYHMVQIMRAPILGKSPEMISWYVTGGMAVVFGLMGMWLYARYRHRIIFWL